MKTFVLFGSEKRAVIEMDMKRLGKWESRILRRIHRPEVEQGTWRIKTNQELREL